MRDVAYGQVPKGRRAQLHLGFTEWVKSLPSKADEFVEIVAWHLEQACLLAREVTRSPIEPPIREAAAMLAEAGGRAERRESLREAHRYYTRALDACWATSTPICASSCALRRADMAMQLGELKEATDELLEVAEQAPRARPHRGRIGGAAPARRHRPATGAADRRARPSPRGREARRADRRRAAQGQGGVRAGHVRRRLRGRARAGDRELCAPAIAIAEEVGDSALVAEGHLRIAALLMSHDLAAAEEELRRCLELADELGSHRIEAEATSWLGIVVYYRGRPDEGERLCLQARTWFERTGDSYFQVQNLISGLAIFALDDGRAEEAEAWLREALPVALQIGGWVVLETYWHLVEALVAQDRLDDARELVAFAARSVPEEDPQCPAWLLLAEALVATAAGESAAAAAAFAEALRLFEELDYPLDVAEARFALGRSLRAFGDVTGARAELERARSTFVRIGADIRRDAIDARARGVG